MRRWAQTEIISVDEREVLAQLRGGTHKNVLWNLRREQRVEQQTLNGATAGRRARPAVQMHLRAEARPSGKLQLKWNWRSPLPICFRTFKNRSRLCYYDCYSLEDSTRQDKTRQVCMGKFLWGKMKPRPCQQSHVKVVVCCGGGWNHLMSYLVQLWTDTGCFLFCSGLIHC